MKSNRTFFYGSLIVIAAGLLAFPSYAFAEEQVAPPIATGALLELIHFVKSFDFFFHRFYLLL